jgi:hypothetical protein
MVIWKWPYNVWIISYSCGGYSVDIGNLNKGIFYFLMKESTRWRDANQMFKRV